MVINSAMWVSPRIKVYQSTSTASRFVFIIIVVCLGGGGSRPGIGRVAFYHCVRFLDLDPDIDDFK